jgi:hypothetical protein
MKLRGPLLTAVLALLAAAGCHRASEPVARLTVESPRVRLEYPAAASLKVVFEPLAPLPGGADAPYLFVHLLAAPGQVLRTFDRPLPGPWEVGGRLPVEISLWQSALAPPLAPGTYHLTVGVYQRGGRRRWPLEVAGAEIARQEYEVAEVEVPAAAESGPELRFGGAWLPPELTGDVQLINQSWLTGEGSIELRNLSRPLRLGVALKVPGGADVPYRLVLDPGEEAPRLTLTSACAPVAVEVSGFGLHEAEVPLRPAPPATSCEVRIAANYRYLDPDTFARRIATLERVTWNALEGNDREGGDREGNAPGQ